MWGCENRGLEIDSVNADDLQNNQDRSTQSSPQLSIGSRTTMDVSQAVLNGQKYLQDNRPVILGISPGNPHYYRLETLERLFDLARKTSEKVKLV